jgi:hypothetical protein
MKVPCASSPEIAFYMIAPVSGLEPGTFEMLFLLLQWKGSATVFAHGLTQEAASLQKALQWRNWDRHL